MNDPRLFPEINTRRLILRKIEADDLKDLEHLANNHNISRWILNKPYPYRAHDAAMRMGTIIQGYKNGKKYVFAIQLKQTGKFIGEIGLHYLDQKQDHLQLSYWLGEPFWNQGYITEAVSEILEYGFRQLNSSLIYADCHQDNIGSIKVLKKNGFSLHLKRGKVSIFKRLRQAYLNDLV